MSVEGLIFTKQDGIATITFDRPAKLNAVTEAMRTEVHRIATELRTDEEVKALIITGTGEAFSTGADASELTADYSGPIEPYILKRPMG
jgi:enoyl-CoA hydratase/carnithine racemase